MGVAICSTQFPSPGERRRDDDDARIFALGGQRHFHRNWSSDCRRDRGYFRAEEGIVIRARPRPDFFLDSTTEIGYI